MRQCKLFAISAVAFPMLLLEVGCANTSPAIQRVNVPVHVACVQHKPVRPAFEFDKLPAGASDGQKVMALARDWLQGRKYEGELESVLAGCI